MNQKACCVTGHRNIPFGREEEIRTALRRELLIAVEDGCTHFFSGFAEGVDLIFAQLVVELKTQYHVTLEAAIPHPGRLRTGSVVFQRLLTACDVVKTHSQAYCRASYMLRNRYMVDHADRVIAVSDGRTTGGTVATIRYAQKNGRDVRLIAV